MTKVILLLIASIATVSTLTVNSEQPHQIPVAITMTNNSSAPVSASVVQVMARRLRLSTVSAHLWTI